MTNLREAQVRPVALPPWQLTDVAILAVLSMGCWLLLQVPRHVGSMAALAYWRELGWTRLDAPAVVVDVSVMVLLLGEGLFLVRCHVPVAAWLCRGEPGAMVVQALSPARRVVPWAVRGFCLWTVLQEGLFLLEHLPLSGRCWRSWMDDGYYWLPAVAALAVNLYILRRPEHLLRLVGIRQGARHDAA